MSDKNTPFFVGYLKVPGPLRWFLLATIGIFVATFVSAGLLIGATQDEPSASGFRFDYGAQTVTGVVELTPYPILRVTEGNDLIAPGKTLMLAGQGKRGIDARVMEAGGQLRSITGIILQRGTIDMLQVDGRARGVVEVEGEAPELETIPLGRWSMAGEICDGKCLYGAMRPGRGLAHKACAALCLIGDVPPVFVSSQPVEGSDFMLLTGPDGEYLPDEAYDYIGQFITLEGDLERRGDVMVLKLDPTTMELVDG